MKRSILTILAMSMMLSVSACNSDQPGPGGDDQVNVIKSTLEREKPSENDVKDALKETVAKQYELAFDLLIGAAKEGVDGNVALSGYSIQTALAMTWAGAKGATADEMAKALNFDDKTHQHLNYIDQKIMSLNKAEIEGSKTDPSSLRKGETVIKTSNNLYVSNSMNWSKDWIDRLMKNYGADLDTVNFKADPEKVRELINKRIFEDTMEKIKDLLPAGAVTTMTELVITNAVYFKADWENSFRKADQQIKFTNKDKSEIDLDFFSGALSASAYYEHESFVSATADLRDRDFKVLFVLPKEGKWDEALAALKDGEAIKAIHGNLRKVNLSVPIFKVEKDLPLTKLLEGRGMDLAFKAAADFSLMTETDNDLYVSSIIHRAFVAMDEKGVEAAAATAVTMANTSQEPSVDLVLDSSFVYVIYESSTSTPLFVGQNVKLEPVK